MIPKTVDFPIPEWEIHCNEQRFGQWNPDIIYNQESALEVIDFDVSRLFYRRRMFGKSFMQDPSRIRAESEAPFTRASGDGLPHINRPLESFIPILIGDLGIQRKIAGIVNSVYPGSDEWR